MRAVLSVVFAALIMALVICTILARLSKKDIKNPVAFLIAGMAVPVLGNLIIILATERLIATVGYYIYFLGMDTAVLSVWNFTYVYCEMKKPRPAVKVLIYTVFTADLVHYILNPFFGFSFGTEGTFVEGQVYYRLIPYIGQTYHRVVCYGLFLETVIIFLVTSVPGFKPNSSPKAALTAGAV